MKKFRQIFLTTVFSLMTYSCAPQSTIPNLVNVSPVPIAPTPAKIECVNTCIDFFDASAQVNVPEIFRNAFLDRLADQFYQSNHFFESDIVFKYVNSYHPDGHVAVTHYYVNFTPVTSEEYLGLLGNRNAYAIVEVHPSFFRPSWCNQDRLSIMEHEAEHLETFRNPPELIVNLGSYVQDQLEEGNDLTEVFNASKELVSILNQFQNLNESNTERFKYTSLTENYLKYWTQIACHTEIDPDLRNRILITYFDPIIENYLIYTDDGIPVVKHYFVNCQIPHDTAIDLGLIR